MTICFFLGGPTCSAQTAHTSPLDLPPAQWVRVSAEAEIRIVDEEGNFPLRYRAHKIDAKGDTVREIIESRDGGIARLVERNGKPISAQENEAERARLQTLLSDPSDFASHHKKDLSTRNYSDQLIKDFPTAMLFTYVPGQPQSSPTASPEVVIDFTPDPNFKPPSIVANSLTGINGRVWIDIHTQHVTRIDGHFRHAVDFGWGVLARIYPGGAVEFEQTNVGQGRWAYSHLDAHLTIRELLFKTAQENTSLTYSAYQLLPQTMSWQDAVRTLLAEDIPTR